MRFEKWQALGNDYAIVEDGELPFELTPERIARASARRTRASGRTASCCCRETDERGFVAEVRIFNPDGSEAELSGNGVREAVMYLRRNGWTEHDSFSVRTAAGEIRPRIDGRAVHDGHGPARLRSTRLPGGRGRRRHARAPPGASSPSRRVEVGNPQCAIELREGLEELDLARYGPPIERHELFPNRTNVSFWRRTGDDAIRARIFERGVGETMSSGTGADRRRRGRGAARGRQPGDRRARRRRARRGGGGGHARGPDRLGAARLRAAS